VEHHRKPLFLRLQARMLANISICRYFAWSFRPTFFRVTRVFIRIHWQQVYFCHSHSHRQIWETAQCYQFPAIVCNSIFCAKKNSIWVKHWNPTCSGWKANKSQPWIIIVNALTVQWECEKKTWHHESKKNHCMFQTNLVGLTLFLACFRCLWSVCGDLIGVVYLEVCKGCATCWVRIPQSFWFPSNSFF
jgi:hypothetical protein